MLTDKARLQGIRIVKEKEHYDKPNLLYMQYKGQS
jgi:hypothetical protein